MLGLGVLAVICKTFLLPVLNFDILQDRQKGLPLFTLARFVDEDTAVCMDRCVYLHIQTTVLSRKEREKMSFWMVVVVVVVSSREVIHTCTVFENR